MTKFLMIEITSRFSPSLNCAQEFLSEPQQSHSLRWEVNDYNSRILDDMASHYEQHFPDSQHRQFWRDRIIIHMLKSRGVSSMAFVGTAEKAGIKYLYFEKCLDDKPQLSEKKLDIDLVNIWHFFIKDNLTQCLTITLFNGAVINWNKFH